MTNLLRVALSFSALRFSALGFSALGFSALGFSLSLVAAAQAGPVCVACSGPDALYQCSVAKQEKVEGIAEAVRVIDSVCVKVLTKTGPHANCRIVTPEGGCPGTVRELSAKDYLAATSKSDGSSKVEGLLPGAARVTTEGLSKTGEAISGSAKGAWHCVSSFFTDC